MTEQQIASAYAELAEYERDIENHNRKILGNLFESTEFSELMEGCEVNGKIEIVYAPSGSKQNESFGVFKDVHVDQWSTGDGGDTFAGFIYTRVKNKWFKIPYHC